MQHPNFWAATHQGFRRERNEDAFLWLGPDRTNDQGYLWLVCDGMGGEAAGELASSEVAARVAEIYPHALERYQDPHRALEEALQAANRRLLFMQEQNSDLSKMGSTISAVAYFRHQLWIAWVGDSRVYTLERGQLHQRTKDHTKFQRMVDAGIMQADEVGADHPSHSVLLNVLGRASMDVETLPPIPVGHEPLQILLCSDGLSSFVSDAQMSEALAELSPKDAAQFLLSAALAASNDNVTVQVIHFGASSASQDLRAYAAARGVTIEASLPEQLTSQSLPFDQSADWQAHQTGGQRFEDRAPTTPPRQQTILLGAEDTPSKERPSASEAHAENQSRRDRSDSPATTDAHELPKARQRTPESFTPPSSGPIETPRSARPTPGLRVSTGDLDRLEEDFDEANSPHRMHLMWGILGAIAMGAAVWMLWGQSFEERHVDSDNEEVLAPELSHEVEDASSGSAAGRHAPSRAEPQVPAEEPVQPLEEHVDSHPPMNGVGERASSPSAAREVSRPSLRSDAIVPRVDPPNEAPEDPNVEDESFIMQRLLLQE